MKIAHRTKVFGCLFTIGLFVALHFARAQTTSDTAGPVMTDPNEDVTGLSDLAVEIKALELATPIAASNEPSVGNFYSAQHAPGSTSEWPPLPGNIDSMPVWPLDTNTYLLDDLHYNYAENVVKTSQTANGIEAKDDFETPPSPGDGGNDTNAVPPQPLADLMPNYGTNLYISQWEMVSNELTGIATNTIADISYAIQTNGDLTQTANWADNGQFILGSDVTNWTQFILPPPLSTNNLFFRLQSEASAENNGLPSWWVAEYFGTNIVDANSDPIGDGWTLIQDYESVWSPTVYRTPPAPQLTVAYNVFTYTATLNWSPVLTPATSYTVERFQGYSPFIQTNVFNLSGSTDSLQDSLPDADLNIWGPNSPIGGIYYQIQAHYASGDSAWSAPVYVQPNAPATISLITGPQQAPYLAVASLPAGTTGLEILQIEPEDPSFNLTNVIEVASSTNGFYPMPAAVITNPTDTGSTIYNWDVELLDANGQSSGNPLLLTGGFIPYVLNNGGATNWMVAPYFDGRVQMKQNLAFLLRAAMTDMPFQFTEEAAPGNYPTFTSQTNFVISDFYSQNGYGGNSFAPLQPFVENYLLRNFAFASPDEGTGRITTGVSGDYDNYYDDPSDNPTPLILASSATYQLSLSILEAGSIPALLDTNTTEWQCSYALDSPSAEFDDTNNTVFSPYLGKIGVAASSDADLDDLFYTMSTGVRNYWGLPFLSTTIAYPNSTGTGAATTVLDAGSQVENVDGDFYPQTAQPVFQTAEYDFWAGTDALPESANFSTTNQSDNAIIVPVGQSTQVLGYAKLAVQNGYPGVYGYLGQYFTNAYEIDTNGNVTTNTTGMLSPYGNFFATQPGPVALTTMPDPDTEQQGTCTVYAVSLALDKNNDGIINTSFNSPDATSQNSPFVFWANNNYDRWTPDEDDNTNYMDDVQIASNPGTSIPEPDCNYSNVFVADGSYGISYRAIPCTRDLEDFARLWVCGVTSNLLAALPTGSTVTLSWGDVGNPNSANPTIDLFQAADANGGIGYLTNATIAAEQTNVFQCPYIGRLGPGQSIQLNTNAFANNWAGNYFIWCGVSNGTGGLTLTIADANSNVLAQTTAYIQIVDIKQMYERWTVGDNLSVPPTNVASLATEGLPVGASAFQYAPPQDTNTPYILFVHGWNLESWDKDRFAETAFKRLYWQGYQGRFGLFRWPTGNGFIGTKSQLVFSPAEKDNYDSSEYNAWQSGQGLLNKLTDLNSEYPNHVYLLAHSMGNVVAGEALRLAGNNQIVNTYVASQAAVTAHTYDDSLPDSLFTSSSPTTPNIYGDWFADNNGGGAGQVISFYNTNDYALNISHWGYDQQLKPDQHVVENGITWFYSYNGSASDPSPWNNFSKYYFPESGPNVTTNFDIVNILNNRYEVMGYAAQAYTTALGATPGVHNVAQNVDLTTIWPPDTNPKFQDDPYSEHFYHSAEFRGDAVSEWNYWNTLLFSQQLGFNIAKP